MEISQNCSTVLYDLSGAVTFRTTYYFGARLCAGTVTGWTKVPLLYFDFFLCAENRFQKINSEFHFQINSLVAPGSARAAEHIALVCRELGLVPIKKGLYFPFAGDAFGETGDPKDIGYTERSEKFFDELAWMARALKWGRENLSK